MAGPLRQHDAEGVSEILHARHVPD